MITTRGLMKRFGNLPVLRGVDLQIDAGRVTAIVGPNAAGKTTLIKSILGLVRPDSGQLLIDGRLVGDDPEYRAGIGYMPQIARFPENLTGNDLVAMLIDLRRHTREIDRSLIERLRLEPEMTKPLRTLSGG